MRAVFCLSIVCYRLIFHPSQCLNALWLAMATTCRWGNYWSFMEKANGRKRKSHPMRRALHMARLIVYVVRLPAYMMRAHYRYNATWSAMARSRAGVSLLFFGKRARQALLLRVRCWFTRFLSWWKELLIVSVRVYSHERTIVSPWWKFEKVKSARAIIGCKVSKVGLCAAKIQEKGWGNRLFWPPTACGPTVIGSALLSFLLLQKESDASGTGLQSWVDYVNC